MADEVDLDATWAYAQRWLANRDAEIREQALVDLRHLVWIGWRVFFTRTMRSVLRTAERTIDERYLVGAIDGDTADALQREIESEISRAIDVAVGTEVAAMRAERGADETTTDDDASGDAASV